MHVLADKELLELLVVFADFLPVGLRAYLWFAAFKCDFNGWTIAAFDFVFNLVFHSAGSMAKILLVFLSDISKT